MAEPKVKKPKLFQLSVMNELVKQNSYLQAQYDRLSNNAEDKYGYHWNEVIQNIIFGRFVKPDEQLKAQYDVLALKHKREKKSKKKAKKAKKAAKAPADQPAAPLPPIVSPTGVVDTRLAEQSTGGASYSYETPFFLAPDAQGAAKHSQKMADAAGATLMQENTQADPAALYNSLDLPAKQLLYRLSSAPFGYQSFAETAMSSVLAGVKKPSINALKPLLTLDLAGETRLTSGEAGFQITELGKAALAQSSSSNNASSPMQESPQARALHDPEMLDYLFEQYFQTGENALRPSSQVRLDELKKENEKSAKEQLQHAAEQNIDFTEKLDDGSLASKPVLDEEGVDSARRPSKEEEKHVRLNRGINVLDQTLIAQPKLEKNLLDRYREQAGAEFKNSEEKAAQYAKDKPENIEPAKVTVIKEGTHLVGRLENRDLYPFDAAQTVEVSALPAGAQRLETRGLANGHGLLRESYEFYVDLPNNQVVRIPSAQAPAPEPVRMKRSTFEQLQHVTFYKSSR